MTTTLVARRAANRSSLLNKQDRLVTVPCQRDWQSELDSDFPQVVSYYIRMRPRLRFNGWVAAAAIMASAGLLSRIALHHHHDRQPSVIRSTESSCRLCKLPQALFLPPHALASFLTLPVVMAFLSITDAGHGLTPCWGVADGRAPPPAGRQGVELRVRSISAQPNSHQGETQT